MSRKDSPIAALLETRRDMARNRAELAELEQQLADLQPQADQLIREAAERWLVDAQGNPIDKGVYWWSGLALVRVNGIVTLIPVETMDEEKVFVFTADPVEEAA